MLKDWTETEVTKLDEFMEDVIIATMQVNKLPIHIVVGRSEQLVCYTCNCTKGNKPKGDNFCNMCDHYF